MAAAMYSTHPVTRQGVKVVQQARNMETGEITVVGYSIELDVAIEIIVTLKTGVLTVELITMGGTRVEN